MKNLTPKIVSAAAAFTLAAPVLAEEGPATRRVERLERVERPERGERVERGEGPRLQLRGNVFRAAPQQLAPQTYLGVGTRPVDEAAAAQLDLPAGVGLVVEAVAEESPAARAGVERFDVLRQIDDQLLVNVDQLTTLVRMKQAGDEVTLTVYRRGEAVELTAELEERDLPVTPPGGARPAPGLFLFEPGQMPRFELRTPDEENLRVLRGRIDDVLRDLPQAEDVRRLVDDLVRDREELFGGAGRFDALPLRPGVRNQNVVITDNDLTANLTNVDGQTTVEVRQVGGDVLYSGPFPDARTLEGLDPKVREMISRFERFLPGPDAPRETRRDRVRLRATDREAV